MTIAQQRQIPGLYAYGMTQGAIGTLFGCSGRAVSKAMKRIGLPARRERAVWLCNHRGCGQPVEKVLNKGRMVGARCRKHRLQIKRRVQKKYLRRKNGS